MPGLFRVKLRRVPTRKLLHRRRSARWLALWLGLLTLTLAACQRTALNLSPEPTMTAAQVTATAERRAILGEITGRVEVRADVSAQWADTADGRLVAEGNQLRTEAGGAALIRLTEDSRIRLGADTRLTVNLLNPFMDSLLTSLALDRGQVWVLLNGGALDVETPVGLASARNAYLSVAYDPGPQTLLITCLQGTCSFNNTFVPGGHRYAQTGLLAAVPEPMTLADYGAWGVNVKEATHLAPYATEAIAMANVTLLPPPSVTPPPSDTPAPSGTPSTSATPSATLAPDQPTSIRPTETRPATQPPAPTLATIGSHRVKPGETIFCLARVYGVEPNAIGQHNGLPAPYLVRADQVLRIPAVRWNTIAPGPVCAPQFNSPYPGLPFLTPTPTAPAETGTPAPALTVVEVAALCIGNCNDQSPTYRLKIIVTASGGAAPLTYSPGREFQLDFPRCTKASGTVTVRSADGQTATGTWVYDDPVCTPSP